MGTADTAAHDGSLPPARIVLVEPKTPGNVGAVARVLANFALADLCLVNPCELGDEALKRAKGGIGVLEKATTYATLSDAVKGHFVVGTTGHQAGTDRIYRRVNWTPEEMRKRVAGTDLPLAILFGREDYGLYNEELDLCDACVTIPANPDYQIFNISHAVAIVLYELYSGSLPTAVVPATEPEKERLEGHFHDLLEAIGYPEHRRANTELMFHRLMGRAVPTKYEFNTLIGVIKSASRMKRVEEMDDQ